MEGTKYGLIFLFCVVFGTVLIFVPPTGPIAGGNLVYYGMQGLLVEQQIAKGEIEFRQQYELREQEERFRQAEHERRMQLQRPARPEEGS